MDAFISHASNDRDVAANLASALERDGLKVWLDVSEIELGVLLGKELQTSILECRVLVLLWSAVAAQSRWVNSEWLMALHQDRRVFPCTLDESPLPQALRNNVFLDLRRAGDDAPARLARAIREARGPTPLAPLMRSESPELADAIASLAQGQYLLGEALGRRDLERAAELQALLDAAMEPSLEVWSFDPEILNLDGYHLKDAYMLEHWDEIQSGVAPKSTLLDDSERRFFETLAIDPTDPSALNGLGSVLIYQRDLDAAEFFIRAAIAQASKRGMDHYDAAEHDLALVQRFR
jgi:hypothetical protein